MGDERKEQAILKLSFLINPTEEMRERKRERERVTQREDERGKVVMVIERVVNEDGKAETNSKKQANP